MSRRLGVLITMLLLGTLGACGNEPPQPVAGPNIELLGLVHQTAAGGRVIETPTPIDTPRALEAYAARFRGTALGDDIAAMAEDYDGSGTVMAAVVAVGCDVPPGAEFGFDGDGPFVEARRVTDPLPECLAAVTTVALVAVTEPVSD